MTITLFPIDPTTACGAAGLDDVERACRLAQQAFPIYRETPLELRAQFFEQIALNILAIGPVLMQRAMRESGFSRARLERERGHAVGQLRLFAAALRDGRWQAGAPGVAPPVGPVVVFGAPDFPLACAAAGGDATAALAAGCPVVVKAHGAHCGTSELIGEAVQAAAAGCGLPEGVFTLLHGDGCIGEALLAHPAIKAVGFTRSRQTGSPAQPN